MSTVLFDYVNVYPDGSVVVKYKASTGWTSEAFDSIGSAARSVATDCCVDATQVEIALTSIIESGIA